MKSTIFIPEKIRVGYQERSDTYTKMLAYVIYYDSKGKLRKEDSWKSWCKWQDEPVMVYDREKGYVQTGEIKKGLPVHDFTNEPLEGFVLNKKVGGYKSDWNFRQSYCRVYDPRGFEFEITIPNLLYILENTNSIKGKGLEGKFVYGWDGKDLVLLPEGAPEYAQLINYSQGLKNKIGAKELVVGYTYLNNKNEQVVYLGKHEEIETITWGKVKWNESKGVKFWFSRIDPNNNLNSVETYSSTPHLVQVLSQTVHPRYADVMDSLEHSHRKYKIDLSKNEYVDFVINTPITYHQNPKVWFTKNGQLYNATLQKRYYKEEYSLSRIKYPNGEYVRNISMVVTLNDVETPQELINYYQLKTLKQYLSNGKEKR